MAASALQTQPLRVPRQGHGFCSRGLTVSPCRASASENEGEDLLSKAARLRQEAQELETELRASTPSRTSGAVQTETGAVAPPPAAYRDMKGSTWSFVYRFAASPPKEDDEGFSNKDTPNTYGGKLTLRLRQDGYTDIIDHEPSVPAQSLDIVKAWGWDVETSAEDEKEYVLFSVDTMIPEAGGTRKDRFYFQARQEKQTDGTIELQEGTVTVKQDVTERKDGKATFWGLFSPKGILARFTYVGNFVARPTRE